MVVGLPGRAVSASVDLDEVATALRSDPVFVDAEAERTLTDDEMAALRSVIRNADTRSTSPSCRRRRPTSQVVTAAALDADGDDTAAVLDCWPTTWSSRSSSCITTLRATSTPPSAGTWPLRPPWSTQTNRSTSSGWPESSPKAATPWTWARAIVEGRERSSTDICLDRR